MSTFEEAYVASEYRKVESELNEHAVLLNMVLMPQLARLARDGQDMPEVLKNDIGRRMTFVSTRVPYALAEIQRLNNRVSELEGQVAAMLLSDTGKEEK
jgi:hypothetical protein